MRFLAGRAGDVGEFRSGSWLLSEEGRFSRRGAEAQRRE